MAFFAALVFVPQSVSAAETPGTGETTAYATLLRTINPHLQMHQSMAYARSILADAERTNLDPRLIMALVTVESAWRPNAISHAGARGLGQLMPHTAATLGVNAWDPSQNLRGAATYLRSLIDRFTDRGVDTMRYAIGAYNAGPHAVEKFNGVPPYRETQNYVRKVLKVWRTLNHRVGWGLADATATSVNPADGPDGKLWLGHTDASALPVDAAAAATAAGAESAAVPSAAAPVTP